MPTAAASVNKITKAEFTVSQTAWNQYLHYLHNLPKQIQMTCIWNCMTNTLSTVEAMSIIIYYNWENLTYLYTLKKTL